MFKLILLFSLFLTVDGHQTIIQFGGIEFRVVQNGEGDRRYIWLHGDEKTARLLLNDHIKTQPGKAFLINNEEREVKVGGLLLDPNRMFSRNGTKKNLQKMNANLSSSELNQTLDLLDKERGRFF